MDRVNLFNPFVSKSDQHEDRATRSIAVTLRYSPLATAALRNYLCELLQPCLAGAYLQEKQDEREASVLDILENLSSTTCIPEVKTQVGSLPAKDVERILSCALIDDVGDDESPIEPIGSQPRMGGARYDLIVHLPDARLVVIFETKKFFGRPDPQQLRPTASDLRDRKVLPYGVFVSCRQLLSRFLALKSSGQAGQAEASVLQDLIDYFTDIHADLSPVLPLSQLSPQNRDVIMLRLARAMNGLLDPKKEAGAGYYRGNQDSYYIEPGLSPLKRINLDLFGEENGLKIQVAGHFGDTQSQATAFFERAFSSTKLARLSEKDTWDVEPNFHLHFVGTHLIWYETDSEKLEEYLTFWKSPDGPGWEYIRQTDKEGLKVLLSDLSGRGLILREGRENEEEKQIWNTGREKFNIAPGLSMMRVEEFSTLRNQDKGMNVSGLVKHLANVVEEILGAAGISREEIETSDLNPALFRRQ